MILITACTYAETAWIPSLAGVRIVRTSMGQEAEAALSAALEKDTPQLVISTGFCGALSPTLFPGVIVLAAALRHQGKTLEIDRPLLNQAQAALAHAGIVPTLGTVASVDQVVQTREEKAHLRASGAVAVEMEGGILARLTRSKGINFLSLRAVLDPATQELPFATVHPSSREILSHPMTTLRLARLAVIAGRAIGRAIPPMVAAFSGRER